MDMPEKIMPDNMSEDAIAGAGDLARTPLYDLHVSLGGKMVAFAGYEMPVQFSDGVLKEHLHTRAAAGLFDVSHMGQIKLTPINESDDAAALLETLTPGGLVTLKQGQMRYTQLTNEQGGILDDLMVTRMGNAVWLVVNAGCKADDVRHLATKLGDKAVLEIQNRALLALQGPKAARIMEEILGEILAGILPESFPKIAQMPFMTATHIDWRGEKILISRCGYTGEDGFEISLAPEQGQDFAQALLAHKDVRAIGLGARDSLRLEAGLCLYGHDIDASTTPVEADLLWSIPKRRRIEANFPGAKIINQQIAQPVAHQRKRIGIVPEGRVIAREGTEIQNGDGEKIGIVTSGGFAPSKAAPIAMGYVRSDFDGAIGNSVQLIVRGKAHRAKISTLPFVAQNYFKPKK